MSQEVSANDISTRATATATADRPTDRPTEPTSEQVDRFAPGQFSVDAYADDLMDEVFRGVDHLLETGAPLPEEKPVADYVAFKNMPLQDLAQDLANSLPVLPKLEVVVDPEPSSPAAPQPQPFPWTKLLVAAALLSLAAAVASWVSQRNQYEQFLDGIVTPTAIAPAPETAAETLAAEQASANQEFALYLQRSIDLLKKNTSSATAITSLASPAVALPTVSVASTPNGLPGIPTAPGGLVSVTPGGPANAPNTSDPGASAPPQTVLERVYIPVYQTPQGFIPVVPGVPLPGTPTITPQGGGSATGPLAASPSLTIPKVAVAPIQTTPLPPITLPQVAPAQPTAPVIIQTLVGVLDLGEQGSAALIEVNGSTRRVTPGEKLGGGWTLVDIKGQEATVRRNGEVRSIFVGQTLQQ